MILKIDTKGAYIEWVIIGFGVHLYTCFVRNNPGPVGFVWGVALGECKQAGSTRFEVLGSYVVPYARRNGIRSLLNQKILEHYDTITTQNGSRDGGEQFMRATGYTLDKRKGLWAKSKKNSRTTSSSAATRNRPTRKSATRTTR